MLKSIIVTNPRDESLVIDPFRPELSGFAVMNITGLGQGKASIQTQSYSAIDGGLVTAKRLGPRNIVFTFRYVWTDTDTPDDITLRSYRYLPVKGEVTLRFVTDERDVVINGVVESNEEPGYGENANATVSVLCPDPYFYEYGESGTIVTELSGYESVFEFPAESISDESFEITVKNQLASANIVITGDQPIGFNAKIKFSGTVTRPRIESATTGQFIEFDGSKIKAKFVKPGYTAPSGGITAGFGYGDVVDICTIPGRKSVTLTRSGIKYNILDTVKLGTDWPVLVPGANLYSYEAETGRNLMNVSISHRPAYGGI